MDLEREKIREVFLEHYPGLCRFLTGIVGSAGAPDIAQESFLRLCNAGLGDVPKDELRFWLFRVGRNLALNQAGKESVRRKLWKRAAEALTFYRPGQQEEVERNEARRRVRELLLMLPEHQRSALILREQEEMSYREIALVLDISESKVKVDIFRGREKLRSLWKENNDEM